MIKFISKILSSIIVLVFLSSNAFSMSLSLPKIGIIEPIKSENVILARRETNVIEGYFDNGNRAYKRVMSNGTETSYTLYVHDGVHVIAEYNGQGELLKEYLYSNKIDEILNVKIFDSDFYKNYYSHKEALYSVLALSNENGELINTYNYKAFGEIRSQVEGINNQIKYTGRWFEEETELYYYRARYYDAKIGRFLNADPIGFHSQDYNLYRYVFNNVIRYYDPLGLWCIKWFPIKFEWYEIKGPYDIHKDGQTMTTDAGGGFTIWRIWASFDYRRWVMEREFCYECNPKTNKVEFFFKYINEDYEYKTVRKIIDTFRTSGINIGGLHWTTDPDGNPIVQENFDSNRF